MAKEEFTMDNFIALKKQEAIKILVNSLKDVNLSKESIISQQERKL